MLDGEPDHYAKYIAKYITKDFAKIFGNYYYAGGDIERNAPVEYLNTDYDAYDAYDEPEHYVRAIATGFKYAILKGNTI